MENNTNLPDNGEQRKDLGQPYQNQSTAPEYGQPGSAYDHGIYSPVKKSKKWIWILAGAALIAVAAVVIALVFFGKGGGRAGNEGVWAAYDYFAGMQEKQESMVGSTQKELTGRLMEEPFEIDAELKVKSDMIAELGLPIPINSITLDFDAKYDMKDFGVKMGALGMFEFGAYLIEEAVVLDIMGQTASVPIDLPIKADLGEQMPLKERAMAFLPFFPEDSEMFMRLLEKFAIAVPDKYTETDEKRVYSPMNDKKVKMNVITTELDGDAVKEVIENLAEGMEEDEELNDELQDFLDDITKFFGLEKADVQDGLEELNDLIQKEDLEDFEFSWSVYEREGSYVGISINAEIDSEDFEIVLMTEYTENEGIVVAQVFVGGQEIQNQRVESAWDGDKMEFDSEIFMVNESYFGKEETTTIIESKSEIIKEDSDKYTVTMDYAIDVETEVEDTQNEMSFEIGIEADCLFGNDLETLEDSRDWEDIYEEDWGDIEDLFEGLNALGSML